jgi:hypothetical protein
MPNRHSLFWCLQQAGLPRHKLDRLPDFLVISPPKTGSTWLADNLRRHPALFVPPLKELKYFSCFSSWLGLDWYLDQFADAAGRLKGEASPSYAALPDDRVRLVRDLMPDVKLVYLMRDPVARAWSHARHTFVYREGPFAGRSFPLEAVTDSRWRDSFRHPWLLASGDYLGHLRRWLNVFPRQQVFIGFYEDIVRRPEALLRDLFAFLGVDAGLSLDNFPVRRRVLEGVPLPLSPALEADLRRLLHLRTVELIALFRDRLHLPPPPEWDWWRESIESGPAVPIPDDAVTLEEQMPSARCAVGEHHGYELVCNRGRFYAMRPGLAPDRPELMPAEEWRRHREAGRCFDADTLPLLKARIDRHLQERHEATRRELHEARDEMARLAQRLEELEAVVERRCPFGERMARWLRRALGAAA